MTAPPPVAPARRLPWRSALALLLALAAVVWRAWPGPDGSGAPAPAAATPRALPACAGTPMPLVVDHQMPYAAVRVGGRSGHFVLDFGATVSSITPAGFDAPAPAPLPGSADRYAGFEFFGPWEPVRLALQTAAPQTGRVRQAGVIGTDFLAAHVYTLDYRGGRLHRADGAAFCDDATLASLGLRALSTAGYYAAQAAQLTCPAAGGPPGCANVPTVPLRIGPVRTVAQLDTGYDDGRQPYAININGALFDALRAAGVALTERRDIALRLSTCVAGLSETVEAWQPARDLPLGLVDLQGRVIAPGGPVTLFVKRTPPAAAHCGGIGTWSRPAAQLGASFVAGGVLVVDPVRGRVWVPG